MKARSFDTLKWLLPLLFVAPVFADFAWERARSEAQASGRNLIPLGYIVVTQEQAKNIRKHPDRFYDSELTGDVFPLMGQFYMANHPSILWAQGVNRQEWPSITGPAPRLDINGKSAYGDSPQICQVMADPEFSYYRMLVTPAMSAHQSRVAYSQLDKIGKRRDDVQLSNFDAWTQSKILAHYAGYEGLSMGEGLMGYPPTLRIALYEKDRAVTNEVKPDELAEHYLPYLYASFSAENVFDWWSSFTIVCDERARGDRLTRAQSVPWLDGNDVFTQSKYDNYAAYVREFVQAANPSETLYIRASEVMARARNRGPEQPVYATTRGASTYDSSLRSPVYESLSPPSPSLRGQIGAMSTVIPPRRGNPTLPPLPPQHNGSPRAAARASPAPIAIPPRRGDPALPPLPSHRSRSPSPSSSPDRIYEQTRM